MKLLYSIKKNLFKICVITSLLLCMSVIIVLLITTNTDSPYGIRNMEIRYFQPQEISSYKKIVESTKIGGTSSFSDIQRIFLKGQEYYLPPSNTRDSVKSRIINGIEEIFGDTELSPYENFSQMEISLLPAGRMSMVIYANLNYGQKGLDCLYLKNIKIILPDLSSCYVIPMYTTESKIKGGEGLVYYIEDEELVRKLYDFMADVATYDLVRANKVFIY